VRTDNSLSRLTVINVEAIIPSLFYAERIFARQQPRHMYPCLGRQVVAGFGQK
jgi:hypothetical protein